MSSVSPMNRSAITLTNTPAVGSVYSLIPTGSAFDYRRSEILCSACARPSGMKTPLVMTPSGRPTHVECYHRFDGYPETILDTATVNPR